ncbi:DUF2895 family protein [Vibrio parahaemolyticus]|uniref:Uncharacterized protein n=4 Tax=Vibrio harveyi group TaxID=717610 RepID=A0AAW3IPM9_VIBPH|nr:MULTISPECIES: DUF2895 family protein [Vibrio harveyi group]MBO0199978.1 DUF2895 family protein [Vibrio alginolyticus]HAS6252971.1 DUF2895 family protein [Vibrio vulnificus]AHJ02747.1 hypothetical protein VPUCM_p0070 [Vibrio parahaemolyticus UCM-V493]APX10241.1 hypothetical protein BWP24_29035 [Vibrio campbellii]EGQ8101355.1 DUF2895 family protein [Vibrio parahaemolyticus]
MSEAAKIDENRRESIKILKFVIAGLVAINIISIYGLIRSFETRQIWVSPDLSSGQMVINSGPYRSYVYSFTYQLINGVWTWAESADKEYPITIQSLAPYMGKGLRKRFESELADLKGRNVAKGRSRVVKEIIPQDISDMVSPITSDRSVVFIDIEIVDRLDETIVSWRRERFSFVVAVDTSNIYENKYGLVVEDYYKTPKTLDAQ